MNKDINENVVEEPKDIRQKEIEYLSKVSKVKGMRVVAWICLFVLAALFVATIILGIVGSKYFMGMLALCILCPIAMYVVLWVGKLVSK